MQHQTGSAKRKALQNEKHCETEGIAKRKALQNGKRRKMKSAAKKKALQGKKPSDEEQENKMEIGEIAIISVFFCA